MKAALYSRVSSDQQRDNYSISTQINEMVNYANKAGYTIVGDRYIDAATGLDCLPGEGAIAAFVDDYTSLEISRPGLDAALRYLENNEFDVLLVHSLDRMARDPYIRETLEREFASRGADVVYVLGNYEATAEGEVRKDLDATFAKWENAKRVERCNRGKRGKAESGKFVAGRTPYGYMIDPEAPGGLAVIEQEAEVVRWIFQAYIEDNLSIRGITNILNDRGVNPRLGGECWGKSSVARILNNSIYAGYCYYNKHKRINLKKMIERDRGDWIKINTIPIIDASLFKIVTDRLGENKQVRRRTPTRFYMLSGKVYCAHCGRPYMAQTSIGGRHRRVNDHQSYRHRSKEGHCMNKQVSGPALEAIVWEKIKALLMEPAKLRKGYEESLEMQREAESRQRAHYETLQRKLKKHQQEKMNLNSAYLDPEIEMTKTEYLEQKNRINDLISELKQKIEQAEGDISRIPTPEALENMEKFADKIRRRLLAKQEASPEDIRHILDMLHVKVYLDRDGEVNIRGWIGSDNREGLSSKALSRYAHLQQPLPERA